MYVSFYNLGLIILPHAPFSPVFLPSELLPQIAYSLTRQSPLTPNTPHYKLLIDFFFNAVCLAPASITTEHST